MRIIWALILALLLLPSTLMAVEMPIVVEVVGEAYGSDLDSPRELYERATADAKRKALEQAVGTFVRSHTVITNGQLAEDLIHSVVRGKIERFEILSQEKDAKNPDSHRVKIRATVLPVSGEMAEGIRITAALSRTALQEGDEVKLQYKVSQASHVYLFVIGADNSVTQLLPNAEIQGNIAVAGHLYYFPPNDSGISLKAQLLPESRKSGATEKIKIIATKKEEPLLHGSFKEGFRTWSARETGLASDLLRRLSQLEPGEWGETTVAYRIAPSN